MFGVESSAIIASAMAVMFRVRRSSWRFVSLRAPSSPTLFAVVKVVVPFSTGLVFHVVGDLYQLHVTIVRSSVLG